MVDKKGIFTNFISYFEKQWLGGVINSCQGTKVNNIDWDKWEAIKNTFLRTMSSIILWNKKFADLVAEENPKFNKLVNKIKIEQHTCEVEYSKYCLGKSGLTKNLKAAERYALLSAQAKKPYTKNDLLQHLNSLANIL